MINMEQFRAFCKHNHGFLLPILAVQDKLRAAAMGRPFWKMVSQRRVVLGLGRRVTLANLIVEVGTNGTTAAAYFYLPPLCLSVVQL
jgi:hypothetical protein